MTVKTLLVIACENSCIRKGLFARSKRPVSFKKYFEEKWPKEFSGRE